MFGCKNNPLHSCILANPGPLPAVQLGGIKKRRGFPAGTPFHIREGVHVKVHKSIKFKLMPFQLSGLRNWLQGYWWSYPSARQEKGNTNKQDD
jgi:hypothetical protein